MPAHTPAHQCYDLTTEHGRAQSFAYSAHGAMLAEAVETSLQAQTDELCNQVETLVAKELERLTEVETSLYSELAIFSSELSKRDAKGFRPLLTAYEEERQILNENIVILTNLVEQLKKLVGVEEDDE
jgi:hypothetical protein